MHFGTSSKLDVDEFLDYMTREINYPQLHLECRELARARTVLALPVSPTPHWPSELTCDVSSSQPHLHKREELIFALTSNP